MSAALSSIGTLVVTILPFSVSTSLSPGPNNVMVTASAVNYGLRKTLPHMLGIAAGFPAMLMAIGLGLIQVFAAHPWIHRGLTLIGVAYLVFLAWKIATATPPTQSTAAIESQRPLTFLQAALFQWVNPKAWIMAIGAVTVYTNPRADIAAQLSVIAVVFALVAFLSVATWGCFGRFLTVSLQSQAALRRFNYAMAALLVASLVLWLF